MTAPATKPGTFEHSSDESDWMTPPWIISSIRATFGGQIDLDPASSDTANEAFVNAEHYFTEKDDGLAQDWFGNVFMNCPWGYTIRHGKQKSSQMVWIEKAREQLGRTEVMALVTINQAAVSQSWFEYLLHKGLVCFPRRRISFMDPVTHKPVTGNKYASAITLLRGRGCVNVNDWTEMSWKFVQQFSGMGTVMQRLEPFE